MRRFRTLRRCLAVAAVTALLSLPLLAPASAYFRVPATLITAAVATRKIRAVDADNHNILINRLGTITLVVGTNEDSQQAARDAGKAMYPFQGRLDFQLVVVVDLRGSVAAWVPSVVIDRMKVSLDEEAIELKPYFLANGNKGNPRSSCHVVPDFNGSVCPQLGWPEGSDTLRGVLFGADGQELKRWDTITDMVKLQNDVHDALQQLVTASAAKAADANKARATKPLRLPGPTPVPAVPLAPSNH